MAQANFWDDQAKAQKTISKLNSLKAIVNTQLELKSKQDDIAAFVELVEEAGDNDMQSELQADVDSLKLFVEDCQIKSFLCGELDSSNAILSIHAGAGGTESCDWAEMLLRMYNRWAERRNWKVEIDDILSGEEAGISKVTIRIIGENAYGYCKAERGVHRLVRISPFDSNKRRHTSFCSVDVIAEIEDDIDLDIKDEEIRIDTYRASGKGGQHVNKTDSAVRITHLATNIVVSCQNERSQMKNKATAMKQLKSRLYEKMQDEKRSAMEKFYGEKGEISWGNQIRSYVFQPYQMVKDLRTNVQTGNVIAVMDGDLDLFVNSWLRAGCPNNRNKEINMDDI